MVKKSFNLKFPETSGFTSSTINVISGTPDLSEIYTKENIASQQTLFVTDTNIAALDCVKEFLASIESSGGQLLVLGSGEKYKTIDSVLEIVKKALNADFNRNSRFVGIGGGVICDMTAFAASIFKRGVAVEFVPTTLLADVDASIGGKTGCDFESYKNMIGSFYPASVLNIWPEFIQSLPEKEFSSGLAEAVKKSEKVLKRDKETLEEIIFTCAHAKCSVVEKDPKEKGIRAFLNLGHTFGHALESVAGLGDVTHGEGVAWGTARASSLSLKLGLCSKECDQKIKKILSLYGYDINPMPVALKNDADAKEKLLKAMHKDKKNNSSVVRLILIKNHQEIEIREVSDNDILEVL